MRRQHEYNPETLEHIYSELAELREQIRLLNRTPTTIERLNPVTFPDPVESQLAIDSRSNCFIYYANQAWREKCSAVHAIKVFDDFRPNRVRDGAFRFNVEDDLDETLIEHVQAFNGTTGTGATVLSIRNMTRGIDILTTPLTIPSGLYDDNDTAVINEGGPIATPNNMVFKNDRIWVNTTAVGAGSKGLGLYITHHGPKVLLEE